MKNPETVRQEKAQRMLDLLATASQRCWEAGGNPNRLPSKKWMTELEQKEFLILGQQIFDRDCIENSLATELACPDKDG